MKHFVRLKTEGDNPALIQGVQPETLFAMMVTMHLWEHITPDLVFTSITDDAPGRVPTSKHPQGYAFDIRTKFLSTQEVQALVRRLQDSLGNEYDVVKEKDHVHCEFEGDRKK